MPELVIFKVPFDFLDLFFEENNFGGVRDAPSLQKTCAVLL